MTDMQNIMEGIEIVGSEKDIAISKEDGRTFHILGDLLLLDDETLKKLFYKLCNFGSEIPKKWGELEEYIFWPSWYLPNKTRVEPDLFLKFQSLALIIEVKRSDNRGSQTEAQWQKEVDAYYFTYSDNPLPVAFIAIGGNSNYTDEDISLEFTNNSENKVRIYKCSWLDIRQQTETLLKDLVKARDKAQTSDAFTASRIRLCRRILYHFNRAGLYYYRNFGNPLLPCVDLTESYDSVLKWVAGLKQELHG